MFVECLSNVITFPVLRRQILGGMLGSAILKDGNPITLHYVMFIPTIMGQGTVEQQSYWISRAWSCNIIGTYAQVYRPFARNKVRRQHLFREGRLRHI